MNEIHNLLLHLETGCVQTSKLLVLHVFLFDSVGLLKDKKRDLIHLILSGYKWCKHTSYFDLLNKVCAVCVLTVLRCPPLSLSISLLLLNTTLDVHMVAYGRLQPACHISYVLTLISHFCVVNVSYTRVQNVKLEVDIDFKVIYSS